MNQDPQEVNTTDDMEWLIANGIHPCTEDEYRALADTARAMAKVFDALADAAHYKDEKADTE